MSPWFRFTVRWARTIHLYLTLSALGLLIFFAVTGFMLNHEKWFSSDTPLTVERRGKIPIEYLNESRKLEIVELLRKDYGAVGPMSNFDIDAEKDENDKIVQIRTMRVIFKRPGRQVEASIWCQDENDRKTGDLEVTDKTYGLAGLMLDLHRGKDVSVAWSVIIDFVALVYLGIGATGIIMWWSLKGRGKYGLYIVLTGIVFSAGIIIAFEQMSMKWVMRDDKAIHRNPAE